MNGPFPQHCTNRLLKLDAHAWRSLRTEVRWAYMHGRADAPGVLSNYMQYLPDDALVWRNYAKAITAQRRAQRVAQMRAQKIARARKAKKTHKHYMRDYMREYRMGNLRRAR